jgi:glycosyltransferase involved in cell wall biosynthesis
VTATPVERPVVLLLITTFDIGGAERVYVTLARGLVRRGYRVIAAALQARSGAVARELEGSGVTTLDLGMRGKADVAVLWRLVRLLRRERVGVVYTFLHHAQFLGRIAARLARTPIVLSSQQIMGWETRRGEMLNRVTARWCSAVVGVSRNVARYLVQRVGIPAEKVVTIYNCVDVDAFGADTEVARPRRGAVIGSIARLDPAKDHPTLFHAFRLVLAARPDARLVLAGAGSERERLEALAGSLGIRDSVEFLGHVGDVRTVHDRLTLYVQSSHVEGMPVAVLEAMAAGLPVVATRVGGNEEAVLDGVSGILVPPRSAHDLADALVRLLNDPEGARRMAGEGRRHAKAVFSADAMVDTTEALIQRLSRRPVGRGWREPVNP